MRKILFRLVARPLTPLLALSVAASGGAAPAVQQAASNAPRLAPGDGTFQFTDWAGPALQVYYHVPATVTARTPIVFVMHGRGRDADRYHREWAGLAETNGFILVVPEFDNQRFPGSESYNYGFFRDKEGRQRPKDQWSFAAIDPLFRAVRARTGSKAPTYAIYGHSAGAQFVHRFALFAPESSFHAAVSANAGSYAFPTFDIAFPFGLEGTPVTEATLRRALAKPMVVLLGTADTDPNHKSLPDQPEAKAQGPHRFARGQAFYAAARKKAAELGVPFGWRIQYAPGVAHSNGGMASFAAPFLAQRPAR